MASGSEALLPTLETRTYGKVVISLENCLLPSDKLQVRASTLDGVDIDTETDLRTLGCELIQSAGILLRLPQVAMATGQVLFQRFYCCKSFVKHPMECVAMASICLASKIEEAPRRARDVINVFHHIKQIRNKKTIYPLLLDQNYVDLKNRVIKNERRILKELGFCVHVKHPHKMIVTIMQVLDCHRNEQFVQYSWNYMNDSLRTDVFLRYSPETIACACVFLSARQLAIALPNRPPWFDIFGIVEEDIRQVCFMLLRLYKRAKPDFDALERKIESLKEAQVQAKLKAKGLLSVTSAANTPTLAGREQFSPSTPSGSPKVKPSPIPDKSRSKGDDKREKENSLRDSNHIRKDSDRRKRSRSPRSRSDGRHYKSHKRDSRTRSRSPVKSRSKDYNKSHRDHKSLHSPRDTKSRDSPIRSYKDGARRSRSIPKSSSMNSHYSESSTKPGRNSKKRHRSRSPPNRKRSRTISRSRSRSPSISRRRDRNDKRKERSPSRSESRRRGPKTPPEHPKNNNGLQSLVSDVKSKSKMEADDAYSPTQDIVNMDQSPNSDNDSVVSIKDLSRDRKDKKKHRKHRSKRDKEHRRHRSRSRDTKRKR